MNKFTKKKSAYTCSDIANAIHVGTLYIKDGNTCMSIGGTLIATGTF